MIEMLKVMMVAVPHESMWGRFIRWPSMGRAVSAPCGTGESTIEGPGHCNATTLPSQTHTGGGRRSTLKV